jgi:hypothetical protein
MQPPCAPSLQTCTALALQSQQNTITKFLPGADCELIVLHSSDLAPCAIALFQTPIGTGAPPNPRGPTLIQIGLDTAGLDFEGFCHRVDDPLSLISSIEKPSSTFMIFC